MLIKPSLAQCFYARGCCIAIEQALEILLLSDRACKSYDLKYEIDQQAAILKAQPVPVRPQRWHGVETVVFLRIRLDGYLMVYKGLRQYQTHACKDGETTAMKGERTRKGFYLGLLGRAGFTCCGGIYERERGSGSVSGGVSDFIVRLLIGAAADWRSETSVLGR